IFHAFLFWLYDEGTFELDDFRSELACNIEKHSVRLGELHVGSFESQPSTRSHRDGNQRSGRAHVSWHPETFGSNPLIAFGSKFCVGGVSIDGEAEVFQNGERRFNIWFGNEF